MSADVQIAHACPHLILEEVVALGSDRRSLATRGPIASSNVVRVLANDTHYVPPTGLYAQAQITGTLASPFRIPACDAEVTVTSSTETATIPLPAGQQIRAEALVTRLLGALEGVAVEIDRGHLVLTDTSSVGTASRIEVTGGAAEALGFGRQRGAAGRLIYPGWELVGREDTAPNRYPRFLDTVRANPTFKVSYVSSPRRCLRCGGTGVENDATFDLQGETILIRDENLLYQAALKIILTRIRSNPFHPTYGSALTSRVGAKAVGAVATQLTEDVQNALATMARLQTQQAKFQQVSARERLLSVASVQVSPSASDPTAFIVDVVLVNAAGTPVSITIVFSVPGVVALQGSNGLSLGLGPTGLTTESSQIFR